MKRNGRKKAGLIYTYWHERNGGFSHPEIRVYKPYGYDTSLLGDELFDVRAQCDNERGFSIFKCYATKATLDVGRWSQTEEAIKLLAKVAKTADWHKGLIPIVRALRKMGAERYVSCDVGENGIRKLEFIPRKYKTKAKQYWKAVEAGLEVQ